MAAEIDYYSQEEAFKNMHASTFKNFLFNGEREALAAMKGEYELFPDKTALLVGNYLHSYFESLEAHEKFIEDNSDELIAKAGKNKGNLKREYQQADAMIERIENDPILMEMIKNAPEREYIISGNIDGVDWKGKLDAVNFDLDYFVDFKTVKTLKTSHQGLAGAEWNDRYNGYVDFFINRGYHIQMAAYKEMLKQMTGRDFECYVIAVTKEDEPLADLFQVNENTLEFGMREILENQAHIVRVINGEEKPADDNTYSRYYREKYRVDPMKLKML